MFRLSLLATVVALAVAAPANAMEVTLKGSPASMIRQNQVARANEYTFIQNANQVERFVEAGYLVEVESNAALKVNAGVSYPYGRPEMKLFLERLANQYMDACGEQLVVTSLLRPTSEQPRNSHPLSVHPAGMAVDLRISSSQPCRAWLEDTLLGMEEEGVLDVTRERNPPHYHIALFTDRYNEYVQPLLAQDSARAAEEARRQAARLAMASVEHALTPLMPVEEGEGQGVSSGRDVRSELTLLGAVALVLGGLTIRRVVDRRPDR